MGRGGVDVGEEEERRGGGWRALILREGREGCAGGLWLRKDLRWCPHTGAFSVSIAGIDLFTLKLAPVRD